jgi:hypothetical protein
MTDWERLIENPTDLARTWLRFASDLEANECLLDEWGRPKSRKD